MAAIDFNMDDDDYEDDEPSLEEMSIDDTLSPLDKLSHYVKSDLMLHRLYVVKDITETVLAVGVEESIKHIIPHMIELMNDPEPLVRNSLIEQLPKIAKIFVDQGGEDGYIAVKTSLLGFLIHFLTDDMDSVRSMAQQAMVPMIKLLREPDRANVVCPALVSLASEDVEEEYRIEALVIMTELAPLLGKRLCIDFAAPLLIKLSRDPMFRVRKICATSFGTICEVIGVEDTVNLLLDNYFELCADEIWGVRKGCVESLIKVSVNVTAEIRATKLTGLLCQLADDPSRWVRGEAFKCLGKFIVTFYQPHHGVTNDVNLDLELGPKKVIGSYLDAVSSQMNCMTISAPVDGSKPVGVEKSNKIECEKGNGDKSSNKVNETSDIEQSGDLEQESAMIGGKDKNVDCETSTPDIINTEEGEVPEVLINLYSLMLDPQSARNIDVEMVYHCAFSFPGVLLALGVNQWERLSEMYRTMAMDLQWKVRRSLAHSIHEVAKMLGTQLTERDLLPIFNSFLKDLDEVKVGVVTHLSEFLTILTPETRSAILLQLSSMRTLENPNNWRYKTLLAKQLTSMSQLYPVDMVDEYITVSVLDMVLDEVACVREHAHYALGVILKTLKQSGRPDITDKFVQNILNTFSARTTSFNRQAFIRLCHYLARADPATFLIHFLPPLLTLCTDKIANVRISLGRMLYELKSLDSFKDNSLINAALSTLEHDTVRDVQHSARGLIIRPVYMTF